MTFYLTRSRAAFLLAFFVAIAALLARDPPARNPIPLVR